MVHIDKVQSVLLGLANTVALVCRMVILGQAQQSQFVTLDVV